MRLIALLWMIVWTGTLSADDMGLKVPPKFKVTLWADHTLANDIYTMALDDKGRVVVSGPGYIRRLEDTNGDGKADKATEIVTTATGAQGLCFTPLDRGEYRLLASADNELRRDIFRDDGKRIGRWAVQTKWLSAEHGGHAIKIGPDQFEYASAGNSVDLADFVFGKSKTRGVEAGGLLRFHTEKLASPEIVAHGFRNPYDFDFTPLGDIITFDSDSERDFGLPWYTPTRVYHVMPGMHHGWRLPGGNRSLARRDYYPDTVPMLADMGRGSPTGVCCYRHDQFPSHYFGGVFLLDWTFGRVHYLPLVPEGSSYKKVPPELFLEATGTSGFAPTAARVAPDGSLLICCGGRGTRGAVYRIQYLADGHTPAQKWPVPVSDLELALAAPQPLEAWSWDLVRRGFHHVHKADLGALAGNEGEPDHRRVRALELLVLRHEALPEWLVNKLWSTRSPVVRARFAWMLGLRKHGEHAARILCEFAGDADARVAATAVNSIANHIAKAARPNVGATGTTDELNIDQLVKLLGHADQRVRFAASRIVSCLPSAHRDYITHEIKSSGTTAAICALVTALTWPSETSPRDGSALVPLADLSFDRARNVVERTDAVRAMMIARGDWEIHHPQVELFAAYSLRDQTDNKPGFGRLVNRQLCERLRRHFPSNYEPFDLEASRLFAMLRDDDAETLQKVLAQITATSHPTSDFHYLTVLARLTARPTQAQSQQVADALLALDGKQTQFKLRVEANWSLRWRELVRELLDRHLGLDKLLVRDQRLIAPAHAIVANQLRREARRVAAEQFLTALRTQPEFPLDGETIDLLTLLPPGEVRPVVRKRWHKNSMRPAALKLLTDNPEEVDRSRFLVALREDSGDIAGQVLTALERLPRDNSAKNLAPLLVRLRQALAEPKEAALCPRLLALINRQAGQSFAIAGEQIPPSSAYQPVFDWFAKAHPEEAKLLTTASDDEAAIRVIVERTNWQAGDAVRGEKFFRDRSCQTCHAGNSRLGPDLAGAGKRLSRDDLLSAIVNPSRDVSPAYRLTHVDMKNDQRISGIIVYDSNETILVQTATETKRLATRDIESRTPSLKSLMPDGLLKGIKPEELADLVAYLQRQ